MVATDLQSKVALVTGGSTGIGKSIVEKLATAGASVIFTYNSHEAEAHSFVAFLQQQGLKVQARHCNLLDKPSVQQLVPLVLEQSQKIDVLVNNAGIAADGLAIRMSDADWETVLDVDLTASFILCRSVLKSMIRNRSGRIINIASIAGVIGNPGQSNYSAAKAGLIGLTKSLAREVGSRGITVNAVAPGFITTDMTDILSDELRQAALTTIPLRRFGTADEVAQAVLFLSSNDAAYITGHVLHIDGGLAM